MQAVNEWLKQTRNQTKRADWWPLLAAHLRGYYNYYAIGGNMKWVNTYYYRVQGLVFKWLNERSQERSYTWEQFKRLERYNPLPRPRLCHGYPVLTRMQTGRAE